MRYCGSCGAMLDPEDKKLQTTGQCPNCGTPFIGEEITLLRDTSPNADTAPVVGLQAPAKSVDTATETLTSSARNMRRRGALSALGALLLFLLLLLACENSTLLPSLLQPLARVASTETTTSNSTVANTTQSAGTQSTETLTAATQGALTPLASPSGNGSGPSNSTETPNTSSATATPGTQPPRATATPAPQPVLTVAPITININVCVASITQFTVRNSGTGVMTWSTTTTSTVVVVLPASGTLMPGQQTTVSVTSISTTTQVTVHAPQAQHAPQVVSIKCG